MYGFSFSLDGSRLAAWWKSLISPSTSSSGSGVGSTLILDPDWLSRISWDACYERLWLWPLDISNDVSFDLTSFKHGSPQYDVDNGSFYAQIIVTFISSAGIACSVASELVRFNLSELDSALDRRNFGPSEAVGFSLLQCHMAKPMPMVAPTPVAMRNFLFLQRSEKVWLQDFCSIILWVIEIFFILISIRSINHKKIFNNIYNFKIKNHWWLTTETQATPTKIKWGGARTSTKTRLTTATGKCYPENPEQVLPPK